jgi:hypothetical protein
MSWAEYKVIRLEEIRVLLQHRLLRDKKVISDPAANPKDTAKNS